MEEILYYLLLVTPARVRLSVVSVSCPSVKVPKLKVGCKGKNVRIESWLYPVNATRLRPFWSLPPEPPVPAAAGAA